MAVFGGEGGVGEELQTRLLERAKTKDSWVRVVLSNRVENHVENHVMIR